MLSSNTLTLSTGNAPKVNQLDNNTICITVVDIADDISLTDSINSVEAFPVVVSASKSDSTCHQQTHHQIWDPYNRRYGSIQCHVRTGNPSSPQQNNTDCSFYDETHVDFEYTNTTPQPCQPLPPIPDTTLTAQKEVLNLLYQFVTKAIQLPLREFDEKTKEKEVNRRIKHATETTIFTSAADRIAAIINNEDKAPRPLLAGIIKTATNNHAKDLNRRIHALQKTQKEMVDKHNKLAQHQHLRWAKKDQGNDLTWTRKETKKQLPQAAATVYRARTPTITRTPNETSPPTPPDLNLPPDSADPITRAEPQNNSGPRKRKPGTSRSKNKSQRRHSTTGTIS